MMGMAMGGMGVGTPRWNVVGFLGNCSDVYQWFHSATKIDKPGLPVKDFLPIRTVGATSFCVVYGGLIAYFTAISIVDVNADF